MNENKLMPQHGQGENIAMDSKVGRMPKFAAMDSVVVDAANLTSDQVGELAEPIKPGTSTQFSTLKAILQQLILLNERLEKWERSYVAYQEMLQDGSIPVYKKEADNA